jgi:predicted ATPase
MTDLEFRHDELLQRLGLFRGDAGNFDMRVESASLYSGSLIEFEAKGVTAIAGANNSGKTTLLNQIAAKLAQPDSGVKPELIAHMSIDLSGNHADFLDWLCKNAVLVEHPDVPELSSFQRLGQNITLNNFQYWSTQSGTGAAMPAPISAAVPFLVRQMGAGERNVSGAGRKSNVLEAPSHPIHYLVESSELMQELNRLTVRILGKELSLDDLNQEQQLRVGVPNVPYPSRYDDPTEYQTAMNALPTLANQGDGMRSLLGILIPLVTATYPIFIIDEPEAFLHPPQAFALGQELGRISGERGVQVILATHDRNLLAGLLNSSSPLSVVRLVRTKDSTVAHQLKSQDLKAIWDDPVLKYSNVLDGLFHELVVLAENERDCRFYEAALDARTPDADLRETRTLAVPATDVLFVPTSGTGGMPRVARALGALKVPVLACPDIDVLDNEAVLKNIVESLGCTWDGMHADWSTVTSPLNHSGNPQLVTEVFRSVSEEFNRILQNDPMALYDAAARRKIKEALGLTMRPWDEAKNYGVDGLMRVCSEPAAVTRLLDGLAERRVVLVHVGQLESFGHSLGVKKGKDWLPAALRANLQASQEVQDHISRLLAAAGPMFH